MYEVIRIQRDGTLARIGNYFASEFAARDEAQYVSRTMQCVTYVLPPRNASVRYRFTNGREF
jgi:hypothetical protein